MKDAFIMGSRGNEDGFKLPLSSLVENYTWSEMGDVVKIVVPRVELDLLLLFEKANKEHFYVQGWLDGHKGENLNKTNE